MRFRAWISFVVMLTLAAAIGLVQVECVTGCAVPDSQPPCHHHQESGDSNHCLVHATSSAVTVPVWRISAPAGNAVAVAEFASAVGVCEISQDVTHSPPESARLPLVALRI
jgi:hypothetical protein